MAVRVQSSPERRPFQTKTISAGFAARTTTSLLGIFAHSWLDQIWSLPELIRITSDWSETVQLQAATLVRSSKGISIRPSAAWRFTVGTTTMSAGLPGPRGGLGGRRVGKGVVRTVKSRVW